VAPGGAGQVRQAVATSGAWRLAVRVPRQAVTV